MRRWLWLGVVLLALAGCAANPRGVFPWKPGAVPPVVAGVRLGAQAAEVTAALGAPDQQHDLSRRPEQGAVLKFYYNRTGMEVGFDRSGEVCIIIVSSRGAASLGGVRVGDQMAVVTERWGPPDEEDDPASYYKPGPWALALQHANDDNHVAMIALGYRDRMGFGPGASLRILPDLASVPGMPAVLPFTREQDQDGARWIWFVVNRFFPYAYVPAHDLAASPRFRPLAAGERPATGDVAVWTGFSAFYLDGPQKYRTATGLLDVGATDRERGAPRFLQVVRQ